MEFAKDENVWDVHVGREFPDTQRFVGGSVEVWSTLTADLQQSKWARSTRVLYQGWLSAFLMFCAYCEVAPLPIEPDVLSMWITRVATLYCFSTVQIAVSAVIGFCELNNFQHPLKANPVCALAMKGARRVKCGASQRLRKALDAQFVLDIWSMLHELRKNGFDSIVNKRALAFTQLSFEAALRGGELCRLKVCDVIFIACGPACGLKCKSHHDSDVLLFVRLHKTARDGVAKVIRLVAPSHAPVIGGLEVSAVSYLEKTWLPFLRACGKQRDSRCKQTFSSKACCDVCPELFPTFPKTRNSVTRAIDISAVTEAFKKFAVLTGRSPVGYSSHAGRIGSYSGCTAGGCVPKKAGPGLGWAAKSKVPEKTYKKNTEAEARAAGLALANTLRGEAEKRGLAPARELGTTHPSPAAVPHKGAQPKGNERAAPKPAGAQKAKTGLIMPKATRAKCGTCQTVFRASPCDKHAGRSKKFCDSCWAERRHRCKLLNHASVEEQRWWARTRSFPLQRSVCEAEQRPICVGFQLGTCTDTGCPEAHACHGCGRRHDNGTICSGARRIATKWWSEQAGRSSSARR